VSDVSRNIFELFNAEIKHTCKYLL